MAVSARKPRFLRFPSARPPGLAALTMRCDIRMQLFLYSGCSNSTPTSVLKPEVAVTRKCQFGAGA